jgi:hypothetical protein
MRRGYAMRGEDIARIEGLGGRSRPEVPELVTDGGERVQRQQAIITRLSAGIWSGFVQREAMEIKPQAS